VIAAGLVARVSGGAGTMFLGTFVACGGIAVCNVLIPVVIKENFPDRIGLITGCYTAALQSAAALGAALTPQLYGAFGGWRPALGGWASIAVLAVLVWAIAAPRAGVRSRQRGDVSAERPKPGAMLRNPLAWLVTAYFGCQSLFAYVIMGWLPEVLVDAGVARGTAGVLSGLVSLLGVPVSLIITPLAARRRSQAGWASGLGVLSLIGAIGLMLAPAAAPILWSVLIGFGMGSFAIAVALISLRSATPAQTEALSTMTQSIGYLISATGPLAFGVLHGVTDSWTLPFLLVIVVLLTQITIGAFAGRDRYV
jgi:CP family cyanate transporter-like MFS transporter